MFMYPNKIYNITYNIFLIFRHICLIAEFEFMTSPSFLFFFRPIPSHLIPYRLSFVPFATTRAYHKYNTFLVLWIDFVGYCVDQTRNNTLLVNTWHSSKRLIQMRISRNVIILSFVRKCLYLRYMSFVDLKQQVRKWHKSAVQWKCSTMKMTRKCGSVE